MARKSFLLNALVLFALVLSLVPLPAFAGFARAPALQGSTARTDAVVLVSSGECWLCRLPTLCPALS